MKWGDKREWFINLKEESGGTMEVPIDSEPELSFWLHNYISAFSILSSSRPSSGFGISPIPLSEIKSYCDLYSIDDLDEFVKYIKSMDNVFLKFHSEKNKDKQKLNASKDKQPGKRKR